MSVATEYIIDEKGEKKSVILSMQTYLDLLEEISDLAALASRKNEPVTSHEDFMQELKEEDESNGIQ